ncbi:MAG: AbrB/MazE/SpoVT family DNA-binding domain-containing protein [Bacteroidia bacterium]|nr:AbrB/MazE/SpoVT family DNA-binding domain-containing protein [Bacteroidia bacterium]
MVDIQNVSGIQAIRIPENFKIDDDRVYLKKVGNSIYIIPYHNPWQSLIESLDEFSDDFMDERDQGGEDSRDSFF